jgi:hypothetical protein
MVRRILAVLLVVPLFWLAGCGNKSSSETGAVKERQPNVKKQEPSLGDKKGPAPKPE